MGNTGETGAALTKPLLVCGILASVLLFCVTAGYADDDAPSIYMDEACAQSFSCNETIIYELVYQGSIVSFGDMNESECNQLKEEIEAQTRPFTELVCRPRLVEREKI